LDEGLAVYNETDDHVPDEQFEEAFQRAVRQNRLILLRSMQLQFPDDSDQAQLAYGQSYSVVKFMIEEYGKEKFAELLDVYQAGTSPDEGLFRVYGMNQNQLENAWRAKLGVPQRELSSIGLPTIAPRPTFEFSSPLSGTATPTREPESTQIPTRVSVIETPSLENSIPAQAPQVPASGLCGGVLALGGLVAFSLARRRTRS
jgi:hypothetical protein